MFGFTVPSLQLTGNRKAVLAAIAGKHGHNVLFGLTYQSGTEHFDKKIGTANRPHAIRAFIGTSLSACARTCLQFGPTVFAAYYFLACFFSRFAARFSA